MDYKISVPIVLHDRIDFPAVDRELKRIGAQRIFLAIGVPALDTEKTLNKFAPYLREAIPYFRERGYEVGIWAWTIWRSDPENAYGDMTMLTNSKGVQSKCWFCFSSKDFIKSSCELFAGFAKFSPDIIMFDDDFRYGWLHDEIGCYCDNHMNMLSKRLGEEIDRATLPEKMFCGGENPYRTAWLSCLGEIMEEFARSIRTAIDRVNPNIRIALCSVMSLWDLDGTDSIKIAKLLAGNTKPLMRFIGAPYWAESRNYGCRLQQVIELERMERSWTSDDIETMAEGDLFPRPRHRVPAAYMEGFDTAIHAADITSGTLKYILDYTSSIGYEDGYIARHVKNKPLYEAIDRAFRGKKDLGIRIVEEQNKLQKADFSPTEPASIADLHSLFFSPASKLLADNSIPTTYTEDSDVYAVFGENAKYLPKNAVKKAMILDCKAAEILQKQGVDTGLRNLNAPVAIDGNDLINARELYYADQNEYVAHNYEKNQFYTAELSENAEILTYALMNQQKYPDTYYYENAEHQKFLVFLFDAFRVDANRFRSYAIQHQLYAFLDKAQVSAPLCAGNPDLYLLCRESEEEVALGLWNFFADSIPAPTVKLGKNYRSAEFIHCSGTLTDDTLTLSEINAFDSAFVILKK